MKKILKYIVLIAFSLSTLNLIWHNLSFDNQVSTLIKVSCLLTIFELLLKPVIKLLLLPINFLTLGLIRFIIDTLGFYLAVFVLADFHVGNIFHPTYPLWGIMIPEFYFSGFFAYLVSSLTLTFVLYFYNSLFTKKVKIK